MNGGYYAIQGANLAAIGFLGLVFAFVTSAALAPYFVMMAALALSIGLHILILELAFNPEAKWDDIKGSVLLALSGALGPLGALSEAATLVVFALGFALGYLSNR